MASGYVSVRNKAQQPTRFEKSGGAVVKSYDPELRLAYLVRKEIERLSAMGISVTKADERKISSKVAKGLGA